MDVENNNINKNTNENRDHQHQHQQQQHIRRIAGSPHTLLLPILVPQMDSNPNQEEEEEIFFPCPSDS